MFTLMRDSTAAARVVVSQRNSFRTGNMAYFCPLEQPHGSQTWTLVPDPSLEVRLVRIPVTLQIEPLGFRVLFDGERKNHDGSMLW